MADRLSWWVIPGALVVLARVVTLGAPEPGVSQAVALEATHVPDPVVLRDAAGRRSEPLAWDSLVGSALVVKAPSQFAGADAALKVWRRVDGKVEAEAWLSFDARVRDDATIPIAGLPAGRYDVQVSFGSGAGAHTAADVVVPGACSLAAPAPVR